MREPLIYNNNIQSAISVTNLDDDANNNMLSTTVANNEDRDSSSYFKNNNLNAPVSNNKDKHLLDMSSVSCLSTSSRFNPNNPNNQTRMIYDKDNMPPLRKQTLQRSIRQPIFWHIFTMLVLSMSFSYYMKPSLKSYGSTKAYDDFFLTIVGAIAFFFSAVAKFGWGTIQDYLGFTKVYAVVLGMQVVVCLSIELVADNKWLYLIWIILTFLCEGAHFVIFPALASDIYGST